MFVFLWWYKVQVTELALFYVRHNVVSENNSCMCNRLFVFSFIEFLRSLKDFAVLSKNCVNLKLEGPSLRGRIVSCTRGSYGSRILSFRTRPPIDPV